MSVQCGPADAGTPSSADRPEVKRRDFLILATGTMAAADVAFSAWPFIDQMNPTADTLASGAPLTIDLSTLEPGQQIIVLWRSNPIFVLRRTPAALKELKNPSLLSRLRDPNSERMQQPTYAKNWSRSIKPEYVVLVGICTHLGCVPSYKPTIRAMGADWPGGYFCPCHGSKYGLAGRVYQGVPAPLNLPIPPYRYENDTSIIIGDNPQGSTFSLSQVETL